MRTVLALLVIGQGIGQVIKVKKALYLQLVKVKRGRYICHIRKTKAVIHSSTKVGLGCGLGYFTTELARCSGIRMLFDPF
jgi:hypothetical protein